MIGCWLPDEDKCISSEGKSTLFVCLALVTGSSPHTGTLRAAYGTVVSWKSSIPFPFNLHSVCPSRCFLIVASCCFKTCWREHWVRSSKSGRTLFSTFHSALNTFYLVSKTSVITQQLLPAGFQGLGGAPTSTQLAGNLDVVVKEYCSEPARLS